MRECSAAGGKTSISFAVVIPTVGRESELLDLLAQLDAIRPAPEIIVVVNSDCDLPRVRARVQKYVDVGSSPSVWEARNLGARAASADTLVFLDDDIRLTNGWLDALEDAVRSGIRAGTGPVLRASTSTLSVARDLRNQQRYRGLVHGRTVDFFAGGNSFLERAAFEAAGGFRSNGAGSDNDLAARLSGLGVLPQFVVGLVVRHQHDRGWRRAIHDAGRSGWADASRGRRIVRPALAASSCTEFRGSLANLLMWWVRTASYAASRLMVGTR
jgi:glycosyltransferase involved in cell wall biosynthesis